jgi:hypothetical protein
MVEFRRTTLHIPTPIIPPAMLAQVTSKIARTRCFQNSLSYSILEIHSVGCAFEARKNRDPNHHPQTPPIAPEIANTNRGEPIIIAGIVAKTNDPRTIEATTHGQYPIRATKRRSATIVTAIIMVKSEKVFTSQAIARKSRVSGSHLFFRRKNPCKSWVWGGGLLNKIWRP